jgi:hypothetical protein
LTASTGAGATGLIFNMSGQRTGAFANNSRIVVDGELLGIDNNKPNNDTSANRFIFTPSTKNPALWKIRSQSSSGVRVGWGMFFALTCMIF